MSTCSTLALQTKCASWRPLRTLTAGAAMVAVRYSQRSNNQRCVRQRQSPCGRVLTHHDRRTVLVLILFSRHYTHGIPIYFDLICVLISLFAVNTILCLLDSIRRLSMDPASLGDLSEEQLQALLARLGAAQGQKEVSAIFTVDACWLHCCGRLQTSSFVELVRGHVGQIEQCLRSVSEIATELALSFSRLQEPAAQSFWL